MFFPKSLSKPLCQQHSSLTSIMFEIIIPERNQLIAGWTWSQIFTEQKVLHLIAGWFIQREVCSRRKIKFGKYWIWKNSIDSLIDNYNQMIAINLDHRLSLLSGELSQHLNVDFTFDQVATRIHADSYRSPKNAYWSAKVLQVCNFLTSLQVTFWNKILSILLRRNRSKIRVTKIGAKKLSSVSSMQLTVDTNCLKMNWSQGFKLFLNKLNLV